jgi:hypothetical protein
MTVIAEGSPVHTAGRLYHSGRGGAGNYHRLEKAPLPGPPSQITSHPNHFFGGRGGAGNVHAPSERTIFSFDEELERDRLLHEHHAPVYSVGRGGAGNIVPADSISTRSHYSTSGSPRSSVSSSRSSIFSQNSTFSNGLRTGADKMLNRLSKIRSNSSQ